MRVGSEQAGSAEPAKISNTETCHASNLEAGGGLQDLALSRRRLDLLTSIRGDKANEPSERSLVAWRDEVIVAPGQSAKRAVGRGEAIVVSFFFFFCWGAVM